MKAHYERELQVLYASARAGNFYALLRVRETSANAMGVVNAVRTLEQFNEVQAGRAGVGQQAPGLLIVIAGNAPDHGPFVPTIDVTPTKTGER